MRLYVDLGAHNGQTLRDWLVAHPDDTCVAFEPNPAALAHSNWEWLESRYGVRYSVYPYAAWTENCARMLLRNPAKRYQNPGDNQSATLMVEKTTGGVCREGAVEVECVDFSDWLRRRCVETKFETVTVKMDIEGAEYAVLDKMLADETLLLVDVLMIELHGEKMNLANRVSKHGALVEACLACRVELRIYWH
jgi:FkbM family methyltransferase